MTIGKKTKNRKLKKVVWFQGAYIPAGGRVLEPRTQDNSHLNLKESTSRPPPPNRRVLLSPPRRSYLPEVTMKIVSWG